MGEEHYGTVHATYGNATAPFVAKPAFIAASTLHSTLQATASHCVGAVNATATNATAYAAQYRASSDTTAGGDVVVVWAIGRGDACSLDGALTDCGYDGIDQQQCESRYALLPVPCGRC